MATMFELSNQLLEASQLLSQRKTPRAAQNARAAEDIARKLAKYGSFASQAQRDFAMNLIKWSKAPLPQPAGPKQPVQPTHFPVLAGILNTGKQIFAAELEVVRARFQPHYWIIWNKKTIGLFYPQQAQVKWLPDKETGADYKESAETMAEVVRRFREFEANPKETAVKYGKQTGICCVCGIVLTKESSVKAGIGPICADGF